MHEEKWSQLSLVCCDTAWEASQANIVREAKCTGEAPRDDTRWARKWNVYRETIWDQIRLINFSVPGNELKSGKCITITELSDRLWERMQAGMGPSCFYYFGLPRFPGVAQWPRILEISLDRGGHPWAGKAYAEVRTKWLGVKFTKHFLWFALWCWMLQISAKTDIHQTIRRHGAPSDPAQYPPLQAPDGVMGPWGQLHNLSRPTTYEIWDIEDKCDLMTIFFPSPLLITHKKREFL